jgi:hypothetical protein
VKRVHFRKGELVPENIIAGFPINLLITNLHVPSTSPISDEELAVPHNMRVPLQTELVSALAGSSDVEPHARWQAAFAIRKIHEHPLEPSIEIVDRTL